MAQGEFTKAEVKHTRDAIEEVYKALGKRVRGEFLGHMNDIYLFLDAAERAAPDTPTAKGT